MHRSRFPFTVAALCLALTTSLFAACDSEVSCPDGFKKDGKLCLEDTDGEPTVAGDSGSRSSDSDRETDSSTSSTTSTADASAQDAATGTQSELDASSGADAGSASDASSGMDASTQSQDAATSTDSAVAPECDSTHACAAGYTCTSNKCVSMCEQTRCDANATCGLTRGAPVCTCKSGYLPMGSGTRPTCVRDLACSELNCSENARCELGSDQLRHCVCKDGYTGDGKNCTAISCPAFSTLRTDHRRVSPSDGPTTVGKVATFTCDPGYKVTSGGSLVCDEEGHWSGTPTVCSLITCGKPTATVEHGVLTTPAQASYEVNDRATYKCDTGYKGAEVSITCSREGTWPATTPPLNCIKACGDGTVDDGEQCDPAHDDALSAWTCDATCKRCPGGVCDLACTSPAISACPRVSGGWNKTCPAGKCVLTGCTTGSFNPRPCPDGSMCSNATCVTASASGD